MLTLRRPSDADIAHFLERQAGSTFSYPDVGATRTGPPPAYNVDRNRIKLGEGALVFDVAVRRADQSRSAAAVRQGFTAGDAAGDSPMTRA